MTKPKKPFYNREINYEQTKRDYLKMVEQEVDFTRNHCRSIYRFHSKRNIDHIITHKLAHPEDYTNYDVIKGPEGKPILVLKLKSPLSRYVQVLSWDDMFDLFMPLHVKSGHRGQNFLCTQITAHSHDRNLEYRYPKQGLTYFRRVCKVCHNNTGFLHLKFLKTSLVYLVPMSPTRPVEKFRYLLIHVDQQTTYIILRPLRAKDHFEIAGELYKIFMQFGPPVRLIMRGYNSVLTEKVKKALEEICLQFQIEVEHHPPNYEIPAIVNNGIEEWMSSTKSLVWEVGCFVVQAKLNKDHQMTPSMYHLHRDITPHSLYFRTNSIDKTIRTLYNRALRSNNHQRLVRDRNRPNESQTKIEIQAKANASSGYLKLVKRHQDKLRKHETDCRKRPNDNQLTKHDQITTQYQKESTNLTKNPRIDKNQSPIHQNSIRDSVIKLNLANNSNQSRNTTEQQNNKNQESVAVGSRDQNYNSNDSSSETRTKTSDDISNSNNLIVLSKSTNQSIIQNSDDSQFARNTEPIDQSFNHNTNNVQTTNLNFNFNASTTKTETTHLNKQSNTITIVDDEMTHNNQSNIHNKETKILNHRPNIQPYTINLIDSDEETPNVNISNESDINAEKKTGQIFRKKCNSRRKSRNEYRRFSEI